MTPNPIQGEQGEERVVLWRYRRLAHPVWNDERASRFTGSPDQIEVATFQRIPEGKRVVVLSDLGELMDHMLRLAEEAHNASPARDERRDAFYEAAAMVRTALESSS